MALYGIADLHLCGNDENRKSMAVFDDIWLHSRQKLQHNWNALVSDGDYVIIPGDFSWAMTLEEAREDFEFVNSLPGTKLIGKGNHDFWWATAKKMYAFFAQNSLDTLKIIYNNSYELEGCIVCSTRGWFPDPMNQKTVGETDWEKISLREVMRLRHSLEAVPENREEFAAAGNVNGEKEKIVFLHFPPVWNGFVCQGIIDTLKEFGIKRCYFGHIHGIYDSRGSFDYEGIHFEMISADHLDFAPMPVKY